jgi:hypothetical protein
MAAPPPPPPTPFGSLRSPHSPIVSMAFATLRPGAVSRTACGRSRLRRLARSARGTAAPCAAFCLSVARASRP